MKLYHASTVKIDNFYISPLNVVDACTVYLHTLEVDVDNVLLCEDLGSDDEWRSLIENCTAQGYDAVQYKNDYEPDNVPSFMICRVLQRVSRYFYEYTTFKRYCDILVYRACYGGIAY
ncbi:hypothetical protein [Salmonella phage SD-6_S16]|nr:hypothetical protein [Salmonella phage SD-6_S16]